jgi:hypothetical protein
MMNWSGYVQEFVIWHGVHGLMNGIKQRSLYSLEYREAFRHVIFRGFY